MACYILAAFHKSQDRFLVIVAMKWYHQTEKDQRTGPEKLPKTEPAATTISLANKSVSGQTWPHQQLQNRHDHEAYVTGWLSSCGTLRHWQVTSQLFLHLLNGDNANFTDVVLSLNMLVPSSSPVFPGPPSRSCQLYWLQKHVAPLPE